MTALPADSKRKYDLGFARPLNDAATVGRKDGARLNAAFEIAAEIRKRRGI